MRRTRHEVLAVIWTVLQALVGESATQQSFSYVGRMTREYAACAAAGRMPNSAAESCATYFLCAVNADGMLTVALAHCPLGTVFSPDKLQCVSESAYACPEAPSVAKVALVGEAPAPVADEPVEFQCEQTGRYENPESVDCKTYYLCTRSPEGVLLLYVASCPGETVFSPEVATCVASPPGTCSYVPQTTAQPADPTTEAPPFVCPGVGRFPDEQSTDCSSYFLCVYTPNNGIIAAPGVCAIGMVFSPGAEQCVDSATYTCPTTTTEPSVTTTTEASTVSEAATTAESTDTTSQATTTEGSTGTTEEPTETTESSNQSTTETSTEEPTDTTGSTSQSTTDGSTATTEEPSETTESSNQSTTEASAATTEEPSETTGSSTIEASTTTTEESTETSGSSTTEESTDTTGSTSQSTTEGSTDTTEEPTETTGSTTTEEPAETTGSTNQATTEVTTTDEGTSTSSSISTTTSSTELPTEESTGEETTTTPLSTTAQPASTTLGSIDGSVTPGASTEVPTTTIPFVCPDEGRYPDPNAIACESYMLCVVNSIGTLTAVRFPCPATAIFSEAIRMCVSASKYSCGQVPPTEPTPTEPSTPSSATTITTASTTQSTASVTTPSSSNVTPVPTPFVCPASGRHPNPDSIFCKSYYLCLYDTANQLYPIELSCPKGSIFTEAELRCVPADEYSCVPASTTTTTTTTTTAAPTTTTAPSTTTTEPPVPQCLSAGKFPATQFSDCRSYIYCIRLATGGFMQNVFRCPTGTLFDEEKLLCSTSYVCPR